MRNTRSPVWLTAVSLAATRAAIADGAALTLIGGEPHRFNPIRVRAKAISADGSTVVGAWSREPHGESEPFRWTDATGFVPASDVQAEVFGGWAEAVSADGQIVLCSFLRSGEYSTSLWRWGTCWTEETCFRPITLLDRAPATFVGLDLSAGGDLVLGLELYSHGFRNALWSEARGVEQLALRPMESSFEEVTAMSSDATIVVGRAHFHNQATGEIRISPFYWKSSGIFTELPAVQPPGRDWFPVDVSGDGATVVGSTITYLEPTQAVRWTSRRGAISLGEFPGASEGTGSLATNADGTVVVGFSRTPLYSAPNAEPFLWTRQTGMLAMGPFLERVHGIDLSGWKLVNANAVSADGNVIAGDGVYRDTSRAFRVSLPPPRYADNDWSGTVDLDDFFRYLSAWFESSPRADADDDGDIEIDDLFLFLGQWFAEQ